MKVKCIENEKKNLPPKILNKFDNCLNYKHLVKGREYLVYTIAQDQGDFWYCIFDDPGLYYPIYYHSAFFEIEDHTPSRFWMVNLSQEYETGRLQMGIPNWCLEPGFYSKLVDGEKRELSIFNRYKEHMDIEFPDPLISDCAEIMDETWLMCPLCIDAWESTNTFDGILKCPMKGHLLHNPRYKKLWEID